MSRQRLTVVLSQAQGKNPAKRALEESLAAALILEPGLDVSIVPHLYDLDAGHTGRMYLESVSGDLCVLAWLYPRAAYWLLDRCGVKGQFGESQIAPPADDEDEEAGSPEPPKGIGALGVPDRWIYPLDLRDHGDHRVYVEEVKRIAAECAARRAERKPAALLQLGLPSTNGNGTNGVNGVAAGNGNGELNPAALFAAAEMLVEPGRRWYPVIDYSRCTNCMECLDFCLFGVYGVDGQDRILVETQDACKRGCPACSRVCPEQAIIFPEYKTPAIAGAAVGAVSGLKIDLTKLFGGGDALAMAAQERDTELVRDGRDAVGLTVGIPKRQCNKEQGPKDDLDALMDALDDLDI